MTLQDQVTSLELSKRLKELNFAQDSLFYWNEHYKWESENDRMVRKENVWIIKQFGELGGTGGSISAFTASELGEMLPIGSTTWRYLEEGGEIAWAGKIPGEQNTFGSYDNEANGRARMLIYLKEQELI